MKKYFIICFMILSFGLSQAQEFSYDFQVLNEEYVSLDDPIILTGKEAWDDPDLTIPLGFDFYLFENLTNNLYINGDFSLGSMVSTDFSSDFSIGLILPFEADIMDVLNTGGEEQSTIAYQIVGEEPNRIVKVEWSNCGFYNEISEFGTAEDRVTFQLWVYESSNDIEFRFGDMTINSPEINLDNPGPFCALIGGINMSSDEFEDAWVLTGFTTNPVPVNVQNEEDAEGLEFLDEIPSNGLVYHFGSSFVSIEEEESLLTAKVFPTLVEGQINIEIQEETASYTLWSSTGQAVMSGPINGSKSNLNVEQLPAGIYFLKINGSQYQETHKLIKK